MGKSMGKCHLGRCLCGALSTVIDPPETGKRLRVFENITGWVYVTWHNGDQEIFSHWRPELEEAPCDRARRLF